MTYVFITLKGISTNVLFLTKGSHTLWIERADRLGWLLADELQRCTGLRKNDGRNMKGKYKSLESYERKLIACTLREALGAEKLVA